MNPLEVQRLAIRQAAKRALAHTREAKRIVLGALKKEIDLNIAKAMSETLALEKTPRVIPAARYSEFDSAQGDALTALNEAAKAWKAVRKADDPTGGSYPGMPGKVIRMASGLSGRARNLAMKARKSATEQDAEDWAQVWVKVEMKASAAEAAGMAAVGFEGGWG